MNRTLRSQVVLFIAIRIVLNTGLRMVFPFLPVFSRGLGVELGVISRLMALRSLSGLAAPFLASLGDTRGRKFGMLLGLTLFVAGMAIVGIFPALFPFFLALLMSMLGYFAFNPAMQAYLSDRVDYERRGRVLALVELGWSLSFIIGVPLIGIVMARYGWQKSFFLLAAMGALGFLFLKIRLPHDPPLPGFQPGVMRTIGLVMGSSTALAGVMVGAASSMANELVALIFGVWLEASFGLQVAALGATAALLGFAELGGELLSAGLVDRMGKIFSVATGLILNCLFVLALALLSYRLSLALICLFFFFMTFEFTVVSTIPLLTEILPAARATLMAVTIAMVSIGRALGDLVSPWLYQLGQSQSELPALLWVAFGVILLNLLALFSLRRLHVHLMARSAPDGSLINP